MKKILKKTVKSVLSLCSIVAISLMITSMVGRGIVHGGSMEANFHEGDKLIISKISYKIHSPSRFDVVIFGGEMTGGEDYIKRIIGLPGEKVCIKDGKVYINDKELKEDTYGKEKIADPGIASLNIILNDNQYFCLGDNRNNSVDSRTLGPVNIRDMKGKVIFHF